MAQYKLKVHVVTRKQFTSIQQNAAQFSKRPEFLDPQLFEFRLKLNAKSSDLIIACAKEAQRRYEMFEGVTSHALSLYDKDFCYLSPEDRVESVLDADDVCYLLVENIKKMSTAVKRNAIATSSPQASRARPSAATPDVEQPPAAAATDGPPPKKQASSPNDKSHRDDSASGPIPGALDAPSATPLSQPTNQPQPVRSPSAQADGAKVDGAKADATKQPSKRAAATKKSQKPQESSPEEDPTHITGTPSSSNHATQESSSNATQESSSNATARTKRRTSKAAKSPATKNGSNGTDAASVASPAAPAPVDPAPSNPGSELFGVQRASINGGTDHPPAPELGGHPNTSSEQINTSPNEESSNSTDSGAAFNLLSANTHTRAPGGGSIPETPQVAASDPPAKAGRTTKASAKTASPVRPTHPGPVVHPEPASEVTNDDREGINSSDDDDEEEEDEEEEQTSARRRQRLSRAREVTASRSFKDASTSRSNGTTQANGPAAIRATRQSTAKEPAAEADPAKKPARQPSRRAGAKQPQATTATAPSPQPDQDDNAQSKEDVQDHVPGLGGFASLANIRPSVHDGAKKKPGPLDVLEDTQSSEEESDSSDSEGGSDDSSEDSDEDSGDGAWRANSPKRKRRGGALATLRK